MLRLKRYWVVGFRSVRDSGWGAAIVGQIQNYAIESGIQLAPGWKVDLARAVKQRLVKSPETLPQESIELWAELFEPFASGTQGSAKGKSKARTAKRQQPPR